MKKLIKNLIYIITVLCVVSVHASIAQAAVITQTYQAPYIVPVTPPNLPPVVDAGPDQNLTSPTSTATLKGSYYDPDGTIASAVWTQIAGPVAATLATPNNNISTPVSGMTGLGIYTFKLSATDNQGVTSFDTVDIKIVSGGPAADLIVVAGSLSPTSVTAGVPATFSATVKNVGNLGTGASFPNFFQVARDSGGTFILFNFGPGANMSTLNAGATAVATTPSPGYSFPAVNTYYVRACANKSDPSTFGPITEDTTNNCGPWTPVVATAAPIPTYTITATSDPNCSVLPAGVTTVSSGGSQNYTISANSGYVVSSLVVDGVSKPITPTYLFSNVTANHAISATCSLASASNYTITSSVGPNGTIAPLGPTTVPSGGAQNYTITPSAGYVVSTVLVDGINIGSPTLYSFTNVVADHTIAATFVAKKKAIIIEK